MILLCIMFWVYEVHASPWKPRQSKGLGICMTENAPCSFSVALTPKIEKKGDSAVLYSASLSYGKRRCCVQTLSGVSPFLRPLRLVLTFRWVWMIGEMIVTGGAEVTCRSATLRIRNITWASRESNSGLRGARPATNHLSRDTDVGNW